MRPCTRPILTGTLPERGSALTEFAICLLPYALLFLGAMILGDLAVSYQQGWIATRWTAQRPGEQDPERVRALFVNNPAAETFVLEQAVDWDGGADPFEDEPVLPYTAEDIARAIVRISHSGNYRLDLRDGYLSSGTSANISTTGRQLQACGYDIASLQEPRAAGIAWMLGTWGRNESAWMSITIDRGDPADAFVLETRDEAAGRFREMTVGGGREDPLALRHHAAAVRADAWSDPVRGSHADDRVDRAAVGQIPWANVPTGAFPSHEMGMSSYWRKDYAP